MNEPSKNHRPVGGRPSEKARFSKHLAEFWRDLQDGQHWKYEAFSPVQILEQLNLDTCQQNNDELVRAEWFWNRRPRLLRATSFVVWLLAALGLPFWLFIIPAIGIPLLIMSALAVDTEIVQYGCFRIKLRLARNVGIGALHCMFADQHDHHRGHHRLDKLGPRFFGHCEIERTKSSPLILLKQ
jgi:hypothetical protein